MQKLILLVLSVLKIHQTFAADNNSHQRFLDSLNGPDDLGNEYCATTLSRADLNYLDRKWEKLREEAELKCPSNTQRLPATEIAEEDGSTLKRRE
jgi:hypothetical protein